VTESTQLTAPTLAIVTTGFDEERNLRGIRARLLRRQNGLFSIPGACRYSSRLLPELLTSYLSLYQSGQTPDDFEYRWMGSVARDKAGDIALGYSRSSAGEGDYPSIYYAGHTVGDPPGTTDAEALILQGSGSQLSSFDRWGDYSSMALDGADGCTFWYTTEYYPADGSFAWDTWLASLKFPNCPIRPI